MFSFQKEKGERLSPVAGKQMFPTRDAFLLIGLKASLAHVGRAKNKAHGPFELGPCSAIHFFACTRHVSVRIAYHHHVLRRTGTTLFCCWTERQTQSLARQDRKGIPIATKTGNDRNAYVS